MEKKENLTPEEKTKLIAFIGEAVLKDSVFPSLRVGINSVTVQELLNQRNVSSLRELGKSIKKKIADYDPEFNTTETLKVGGFDADKVVEALKLMIKYSEYTEWKKVASAKKSELKAKIESAKSPTELKQEWEKELAELDSIEA